MVMNVLQRRESMQEFKRLDGDSHSEVVPQTKTSELWKNKVCESTESIIARDKADEKSSRVFAISRESFLCDFLDTSGMVSGKITNIDNDAN